MTKPTYQTAIFDLDGTLLDTLEDLYRATNQALDRHGLPTRTRDEVRMFVGNGVEMLIRRAVPSGTEEGTIGMVLADFKRTYAAICEDHTAPYAGMLGMLSDLRDAGIRTAVVSNKFDEATKRLCRRYFGELVEVTLKLLNSAGLTLSGLPKSLWSWMFSDVRISPHICALPFSSRLTTISAVRSRLTLVRVMFTVPSAFLEAVMST